MRIIRLTLFLIDCIGSEALAQASRAYTLEVSCSARSINSSQSELAFRWPYRGSTPAAQRVYRKSKETLSWGSVFKNLNISDSTFRDTVNTGSVYEYRFEKDTAPDGYSAVGFVLAGHRQAALTSRGRILILADSLHKSYLSNDIRTYRNDLIGDGWYTELKWLDSNTTVAQIKSYIVSRAGTGSIPLKSVVLIGNLAVPYSGDFSRYADWPPDGHVDTTIGGFYYGPSHEGAWPADGYFSDLDNPTWPDSLVNNTLGARSANYNVPNDGKFDNNYFNSILKLQIGRIDVSDLPAFSLGERDLLRRYFIKNHRFKHNIDQIQERCLMDDRIGLINYPYPYFDENFGNNAFRNLAPLISSTSVSYSTYLSTLNSNDYLWSFAIGFSNSYTGLSSIGQTSQIASSSQQLKSVFNGYTGSYICDFDVSNSFLRAPLAALGNTLNTFWCGRPDYYFHHMAMGETIGYSMLRTLNNIDTSVNNTVLYPSTCYYQRYIHTNLLGDPAVRMQPVMPASAFKARQDSCFQRVKLSWTASTDTAVHSYYIFRAKHIDSVFTLLGKTSATQFTDSFPLNPESVYMLRAEKLQQSGSGTYFNLSQGLFDTLRLLQVVQAPNAAACLNSNVCIGVVQNNMSHVQYNWTPSGGSRDTSCLRASASGTYILSVSDSESNCVLRDTVQLSVLPLPLKDSIVFTNNACSDTVFWHTGGINGSGFGYHWVFNGAQPSTMNAYMLDSPGMVRYAVPGTFSTVLRIYDTLSLCEIRDTMGITVLCSSLPNKSVNINCLNTINGHKIDVFIGEPGDYKTLQTEYFTAGGWQLLEQQAAGTAQHYTFTGTQAYAALRISGTRQGGSTEIFEECRQDETSVFAVEPNPASNWFRISCNRTTGTAETRITLIDCLGIVRAQYTHSFSKGSLELPLNSLAPGIYHVILETLNKNYTIKLIVL